MLFWASLANAQEVQLVSEMRAGPPPLAAGAVETRGEWNWLTFGDARRLRAMPARWKLLVSRIRFEKVRVIVTAADGRKQDILLDAGELGSNWAPGGLLAFDIRIPGPQVSSVSLGFESADKLSFVRKVTAAAPAAAARDQARWLILMGIFTGLLASGFAYTLFVYTGQRRAFQRWYLGWVGVSLTYGLIWTNLAAYVFPVLAGPVGMRVYFGLVGLTAAMGGMFLLSILEPGKVPRRLRRAILAVGLASIASGILAADERVVPAALGDLVLNLCLLACLAAYVLTVVIAMVRGSRVIKFYLLGWLPVLVVFAIRTARNFGLVGQSDMVDFATFAAMGFESVIFSLLIASRFRVLHRERDVAEANARSLTIEQDALRRAARTDFLTGLGNRAAFHEAVRELFERRACTTLYLIDIDYLKELNDRQGHDAGDALLQWVGQELANLAGPVTSCARIGGDEFAILCDDREGESARIARQLDLLQRTAWVQGRWSGLVSLSIGMAGSNGAANPADLFRQADMALYEAKSLGRGRRQAFDSHLRQRIQTRLDLINGAHDALSRGEFKLHFQPIVDLRTGDRVSMEALLRWQHPQLGLLTPEYFECVLTDEEIGPLVQERVLSLALEELRRPGTHGTLAVNFTGMDLQGTRSAHQLLRKLAAAGVAPSSLCIEVTEGTILGKRGDPAAALRVLHDAGVRIALDDFGTGYASLVHLKEIPVDTLKIDKSFIAGLADGGENEEIVRAVLALGHGLNKKVVAEGVETEEQLARLRQLGCDFAQGYLFGRPSPPVPFSITFQRAA